MSYWKKAATCAAAALTGLILATAPASATDYPTTNFGPTYKGPSYGATWARGTLTWYDRGVHVKGEVRSVSSSDCRVVVVFAGNNSGQTIEDGKRSSSVKCGVAVHPIEFTVPANVSGGAAYVQVCLDDNVEGDHYMLICSMYSHP